MDTTLVTGSTGLVGYQIVQALLRRGRPVKLLVRSIDKGRALLPEACQFVQADITDRAAVLRAMEGCAVVYHAAGLPEQWLFDPAVFDRVNVGGTHNMLEAASALSVRRFIYTSTYDVFAGQAGQYFDESCLDPQPRGTFYERSKQKADQQVVAALQRGLPAIFLHPSAIYGPGPASSPGLNHAIRQLLQGRLPALPPGGCALVFAPDVGEGHVLAEECAPIGSRYILSEAYYSLAELAPIALAEAGLHRSPPPTIPLPIARAFASIGELVAHFTRRPPLIPKGGLNFMQWGAFPRSDKAQRELGWRPTPLRDGLRQTIAYLNRQPSASMH
jgi:nucleoside-diphosphate-sugar epimerase